MTAQADQSYTPGLGGANAFDAIVVGAGFAGLYMLHRLRALGLTARVLEAGGDVGGTWYWNRYPGARCDVESMQYSYSFSDDLQQEWHWSERFAPQPEILAYANHVADRFDLRRDIQFNSRVTAANYDEVTASWRIRTETGEAFEARLCIMATGCLSAARMPSFPGLESFRGQWYHTGAWPHEPIDFTGQRVGVIGTGSSGIQIIPVIAEQAAQLVVFQRTPNFSFPARNVPMDDAYERSWKNNYAALRRRAKEATTSGTVYDSGTRKTFEVSDDERLREFEARWQKGGINFLHAYTDLAVDKAANDAAASFIRSKIREMVRDPRKAEKLQPMDHPVGAKRPCMDTGYFETFNRENVTLVDLRETPIETITPEGVRTSDQDFSFDSLVFATGYDAMTGALLRVGITGRGGLTIQEKWRDGPRTYLGLMIAGFPNLFTVTGPGSPSVLSNVIFSIEQHVEWIADCLAAMQTDGHKTIEATQKAEDAWVEHVNEVADRTLFPQANSWYNGGNIPGKPRIVMPYCGGVVPYRRKCEEVAARGYEGFVFDRSGTETASREHAA